MTHALCMLDNVGYRYALRICNTYYFSNANVVMPSRLNCYVMRILNVFFYGLL